MNDRVTYQGRLYRAYTHHTAGASRDNHPGSNTCEWELLETCPADCCARSRRWRDTQVYVGGDEANRKLFGKRRCFRTSWWQQGSPVDAFEDPRSDASFWGPWKFVDNCSKPFTPTCQCAADFEYIKSRGNGRHISGGNRAGTKLYAVHVYNSPIRNELTW